MATNVYILDERNEGELNTKINMVEVNIRNVGNDLSAHISAANNKHYELENSITNTASTLRGEINAAKKELTADIDDTETNLKKDIGDNAAAISSNMNEIAKLDSRLGVVEDDVNTFLANADLSATARDTLREIQDYINSDVTAAATMTSNIQKNATAISTEKTRAEKAESNLNTAISTEKTRAQGVESGLNTRLTTAESDIDSIQSDASALETLVSNLSNTVTNLTNRIAALEGSATEAYLVDDGNGNLTLDVKQV